MNLIRRSAPRQRPSLPTLLAAALLGAWTGVAGAGPEDPPLWGGLRPGPHAVGFRVVEALDPTRSYPAPDRVVREGEDDQSRPIRIAVWYPATAADRGPMRFQDYVGSAWVPVERIGGEVTADDRARALSGYRSYSHPGSTPESFDRLLKTRTAATRDAGPSPGRFPLLIYGCGFDGKPPAHSVTCEYLASHGYVVACSSSQGATSLGMTFDGEGMEAQARDMEFTIGRLRESPGVDATKVGIVGVSFGSEAALIVAMKNPGVSAVASLDGSIGFWNGLPFLKAAPSFDPARMRAPLMHMNTSEDPYNDLSVVESLVFCDRLLLNFRGIVHEDFFPVRVIASATKGPPPERSRVGYEVVCRQLRRFFDAHLKGDRAAWEDLRRPAAAGEGLPPDLFTVRHDPVADPPPTEGEFVRLLLAEGGPRRALPVLEAALERFGGRPFLPESTLSAVGRRLAGLGRREDAVLVGRMAVASYPHSSAAFEGLADAYRAAGDAERAAESYRKSLELEPRNSDAADALKVLRKGRGR